MRSMEIAPCPAARVRLRFGLAELLGVVGLAAAGAAVFAPFVSFDAWSWSNIPGAQASAVTSHAALALFFAGLAGGAVALIFIARCTPFRGRALVLAMAVSAGIVPLVQARAVLPACIRPPIEANESSAIAACRTYAEAQAIFHRTDWDTDGVLEYAQSLQVRTAPGSSCCNTLGLDMGLSSAEGPPGVAQPKAGYVFKILKAQGPNATGGAMSYLTRGADGKLRMTEGYALLAVPAEYGVSGRATFIVNQVAVVFQRDFGPQETAGVYARIEAFDPGPEWTLAE